LGWSEIARGGLEVEVTPGGHTNQILEPNTEFVAEKLLGYINRVAGG
jgi:hypothetical protein